MSQTNSAYEKIQSEPEITNTEQSMQNESDYQNFAPFDIIYNHRQNNLQKNRKLFYLSRRRFLRKQRKQQLERKRLSITNDLRKQRQMELIESFISLDCSDLDLSQENLDENERGKVKSKKLLYQDGFVGFQYKI